MPESVALRVAGFADLDTPTLYALLRLRVDVFVVEQQCPYPELDGRDTEPATRHMWSERDGRPIAYLRLLAEPDGGTRIGRVAVARPARGEGHAGRLLRAALVEANRPGAAGQADRATGKAGPAPGQARAGCVLDAQAHLVDFYGRFGFVPTGAEFVEDGIPHVPMRLA